MSLLEKKDSIGCFGVTALREKKAWELSLYETLFFAWVNLAERFEILSADSADCVLLKGAQIL